MHVNKHYLITGGSGFLGTALVERLCRNNKITVVARNEGNLLKLKQRYPSIHIITGDIAERCVCEKAVYGVDGIFHLAGFKHVGLAERDPFVCVNSNVNGSLNLLKTAHTGFIIGISTDKAAQVSGVYGATKLLMERLFAEFQEFNPKIRYRIVRYGNVLYSTGSVLCKWKDALLSGQPITISDPEATRFYWSVQQAVDLIFECLEKATSPAPYVPTMKAMRLGDILMAMEEKYGKAVDVVTAGLKQGENKHERILDNGPTSEFTDRYTFKEILELV